MDKVQFFGCYDFNEDWYLVEMLLDESSSDVDLYEFLPRTRIWMKTIGNVPIWSSS